MKSPCFKCDERAVGCHSKCSKYLDFRKTKDEINEKIRQAKAEEDFYIKSKQGLRKFNK